MKICRKEHSRKPPYIFSIGCLHQAIWHVSYRRRDCVIKIHREEETLAIPKIDNTEIILSTQTSVNRSYEEKAELTVLTVVRRLLATAACLFAVDAEPAVAQVLDLENLDGPTAVQMMEDSKLTSVELTKAYIARIIAVFIRVGRHNHNG